MKIYRANTQAGDKRPVVVFLHGFMGNARDWDAIIEQLAPDFACVTVDLPGHGDALVPESEPFPDMAATAALLTRELAAAGIDRFSLVGYSMGGRVALYTALHLPERIDRLVLESASPGLRDVEARVQRRKHDEALARRLVSEDLGVFLREWYEQPLFESLYAHPERLEEMMARRLENDPTQLARSLRAIGTGVQPPLWDALPSHQMPTLLLAGEKDAKFAEIAQKMAQAVPSARVHICAECGHNIHFEHPESFAGAIRKFLLGP